MPIQSPLSRWSAAAGPARAGLASLILALSTFTANPRHVTAAGPASCGATTAPALVYALRGSVYRANPDGRQRCRLTVPIDAKEPQLAPGGRFVAFLSGVGSYGSGNGAGNVPRLVRVGSALSSGFVVRRDRALHRRLSWSPDGRWLAFVDGTGVWGWSVACRCTRVLVAGAQHDFVQSLVWSPDSRQVAVRLVPATGALMNRVVLTVAPVATRAAHRVVITFPAWVHGPGNNPNQYPSQVIAWQSDGNLLIETSGVGIGLPVTGLWTAPAAGGAARLLVGTRQRPGVRVAFPLLNSTQALLSPDGKKLLLDPNNRFWISSSGHVARVIDPRIRGSCGLSQAVWVGTDHLAYITVCTIGGSPDLLARLYTLSLRRPVPRLLAIDRSRQQDTLSIAPPTQCIGCGAR